MRFLASFLNDLANSADNNGHSDRAVLLYKVSALVSPSWSVPHYNLGLMAKRRGSWHHSLAHNQRAAGLDPSDQAAWWNLAIAATALHDWPEAQRAWHAFGIDTAELRDGQLYTPPSTACVRLDPNGKHPEVVWGTRLDPARIEVLSVPLPRSERRYRDIILNDGELTGERTWNGSDFPVFNELAIWKLSPYSTFAVTLRLPDEAAEQTLSDLCKTRDIALENRGNVRTLCETCSRGNPGVHVCAEKTEFTGDRNFSFASTHQEVLVEVLHQWAKKINGADFSPPKLELLA